MSSGLDVLGAIAHVAHLAASGPKELDPIGLLSDAGVLQGWLRMVSSVLLVGDETTDTGALLEQLRDLEAHVDRIPKEGEQAPSTSIDPPAEVRRLRAILLEVAFDLERLAVQPARSDADRQVLTHRAQAVRWGLSGGSTEP